MMSQQVSHGNVLAAEVQVLHAENARLREELAEAQQRIAELEAENERLREQVKDLQQTSSRSRRRRKSHRKHDSTGSSGGGSGGRKEGHAGSGRKRPTHVDHTEHIPAGEQCPECGTPFTGDGVERERYVEDIEPVRPTRVTRYRIERRWCPHCRTYQEAPVTAALPHHQLGLHVMLFVVYQKVALSLSYGKIQHELATYFGLQVSQGELSNLVAEVADRFGPAYQRLIAVLRQQAAVHVDETGWRIHGDNHWLWVFLSDVVTLYVVSQSRGHRVPEALLGATFEGSLISDFYSAYSPLDYQKGKCWAHLLRDARELLEGKPPPDSERVTFEKELHQLFLDMGLALEQATLDEEDEEAREAVSQEMRSQLQAFAQQKWEDADCQRLADRILEHVDELVLWLRDPAVDPTNNAAERALRPAVITRKTSFGSQSKKGALDFARLLSLIQTWEQQGHDFFTYAHRLLSQSHSQD
jgi:FtsZ-binding cell division protein ZapB